MKRIIELNVDDKGMGGVFSLVRNIILNIPEGLQIDIAAILKFENSFHEEELRNKGTFVHFVGYKGPSFLRPFFYYYNTLRLLKKCEYSCAHVHSDVSYMMLPFALAAKRAKVDKIILHAHAAGVDGKHAIIKRILHKTLCPLICKMDAQFVACSDKASEWMYPGIPQNKVLFIRNGIPLQKFRVNKEVRNRIRNEMNLQGKTVLGHIGRFSSVKNHDFLLKVLARTIEVMPDVMLLLVGEGYLFDSIKNKTNEMGLSERVVFMGTIQNTHEVLQAMDVFLLPSLSEGFSIACVEAEAAGVPVIVSDTISRQIKLVDNVSFLSCKEDSVDDWTREIEKFCGLEHPDNFFKLYEKGYDISSTIRQCQELYEDTPMIT